MNKELILILCFIFTYFFFQKLIKYVKLKIENTFDVSRKSPTGTALPFITFLFLLLACFHYKEDCWHYDTFCVEYPYGFYTILRFIVCSYFSYNAYLIWKEKNLNFACVISLLFAITYNPFVKVTFETEEWVVINIISIIALITYQTKYKIK